MSHIGKNDAYADDVTVSGTPILDLFVIAMPIAAISWTVTHEEIFREPRDWCSARSKNCSKLLERKFFYLFTCEFCFSHYVTALFLFITRYKLLFDDWRGYLIGGFSLVWVANFYMSIFGRVRLDIKRERIEIEEEEKTTKDRRQEQASPPYSSPRSGRDEGFRNGSHTGAARSSSQ